MSPVTSNAFIAGSGLVQVIFLFTGPQALELQNPVFILIKDYHHYIV